MYIYIRIKLFLMKNKQHHKKNIAEINHNTIYPNKPPQKKTNNIG